MFVTGFIRTGADEHVDAVDKLQKMAKRLQKVTYCKTFCVSKQGLIFDFCYY